jgi:hypothetical protein
MRTKQIIPGLKNSQKFRAVINGVIIGDNQVKDLESNRFQQVDQRIAVWNALEQLSNGRRKAPDMMGFGRSYTFYDDKMNKTVVDVQVDLV